jgi:hypothetical protein
MSRQRNTARRLRAPSPRPRFSRASRRNLGGQAGAPPAARRSPARNVLGADGRCWGNLDWSAGHCSGTLQRAAAPAHSQCCSRTWPIPPTASGLRNGACARAGTRGRDGACAPCSRRRITHPNMKGRIRVFYPSLPSGSIPDPNLKGRGLRPPRACCRPLRTLRTRELAGPTRRSRRRAAAAEARWHRGAGSPAPLACWSRPEWRRQEEGPNRGPSHGLGSHAAPAVTAGPAT